MKQVWNGEVHILNTFILIMLSISVVGLLKLSKQLQS